MSDRHQAGADAPVPGSSPARAAADDEPRSPMWLPALGGALFLAVGLWWAVTPSAPPPAPEAAASASAPPSVPAPPPAAVASANPPPIVRGMPPQAPSAAVERLRNLQHH